MPRLMALVRPLSFFAVNQTRARITVVVIGHQFPGTVRRIVINHHYLNAAGGVAQRRQSTIDE